MRGTRVRDLASSQKTAEEAKKYLPPFLSNEEKDRIIQILSGFEETSQPSRQDEACLRAFVRGIIRG